MKQCLFTIVFALLVLLNSAHAQKDSTHTEWFPYAASGILVATGTSFHTIPALKQINLDIQNSVQDWRTEVFDGKPFHIDNIIQWLPIPTMYLLSACGVRSKEDYIGMTFTAAGTYATMGTIVLTTKYLVDIQRPDGSAWNTFPSGHTATAFAGAEMLRLQYKDATPWIGIAGYALAAGTSFLRIYNNRHWTADVLAGAGIGILSAQLANWLAPKVRDFFMPRKPNYTYYIRPILYED